MTTNTNTKKAKLTGPLFRILSDLIDAGTTQGTLVYRKKTYHFAPCFGAAHTNAYIDYCMCCLGQKWGTVVRVEV